MKPIMMSILGTALLLAAACGGGRSRQGSDAPASTPPLSQPTRAASSSPLQVTITADPIQRVGTPTFLTVTVTNNGADINDLKVGYDLGSDWVFNKTAATDRSLPAARGDKPVTFTGDGKYSYGPLPSGQSVLITVLLVPKKAGNAHGTVELYRGGESSGDVHGFDAAINP
jgi:hypothetical protein